MTRHSLPPELGSGFAVRDAISVGVSRSRLRAADLEAPFRGVRQCTGSTSASGDPSEVESAHLDRALLYAATEMTASQFFTHSTAAIAWGLPLPAWASADRRVDVGTTPPGRSSRAATIQGHHVLAHLVAVTIHPGLGIRLTTPAVTWAMLGARLHDIRDVVAVGDAAVRRWRNAPLTSVEALEDAVRAGRRVGINRLREALPLIREGAASRGESWTRRVLVEAGLHEPELNAPVDDGRGAAIGHGDLVYRRERVVVEYEGDHHRTDREQWAHDIRRYEQMAAVGWRVVRVTRDDIFGDPAPFIRRVRSALAAG